jgi:hydroxymethylpyrimidine/phosphomethylpyrimidine kinase
VVRDFLTARTLGASVRLIPTAWTEQSSAGVQGIEPRDPLALAASVRRALQSVEPAKAESAQARRSVAVKIGMIPDAALAAAVQDALSTFNGPVVLDPVLSASSGGSLFFGDVRALVVLGARAALTTPNAGEAATLTGLPVHDVPSAVAAGTALCEMGLGAVLVKGGHLDGDESVDVLVSGRDVRLFRARRLKRPEVRGTGCALATAIAVGLGAGLPLGQAIVEAKEWLAGAIRKAVAVGGEWHLG